MGGTDVAQSLGDVLGVLQVGTYVSYALRQRVLRAGETVDRPAIADRELSGDFRTGDAVDADDQSG